MTMPGYFYTIAEINHAVGHFAAEGEHNPQAKTDPDLATLVEELAAARRKDNADAAT